MTDTPDTPSPEIAPEGENRFLRELWDFANRAPVSDPLLTPVVCALQEIGGLRSMNADLRAQLDIYQKAARITEWLEDLPNGPDNYVAWRITDVWGRPWQIEASRIGGKTLAEELTERGNRIAELESQLAEKTAECEPLLARGDHFAQLHRETWVALCEKRDRVIALESELAKVRAERDEARAMVLQAFELRAEELEIEDLRRRLSERGSGDYTPLVGALENLLNDSHCIVATNHGETEDCNIEGLIERSIDAIKDLQSRLSIAEAERITEEGIAEAASIAADQMGEREYVACTRENKYNHAVGAQLISDAIRSQRGR